MKFVATIITTLCFVFGLFVNAALANDEWKPLDPAQLAQKTSVVEKDADAEALLWEMRVEKSEEKATISHYVRLKIFTDRGREQQSTVEIPYYKGLKIKDVFARTIKANGQIVPLEPSAIFDKEVYRANKFKVNVITFAMPAVEPGAIIEYRWREEQKEAFYLALDLQRNVPVQSLQVAFKAKGDYWASQITRFFQTPEAYFKDDGKGWRSTTITNVPAFRAEPNMPPANAVKAWMIAYTHYLGTSPGEVWNYFGKMIYEEAKDRLKVTDEIKKTAQQITAGWTTDEQRLEKLYAFCQTNIKNINYDYAVTAAERSSFKENKTSNDTLRQKMGTGEDINLLFGALANALGFEARHAKLADRDDVAFSKDFPVPYYFLPYMTSSHIVVNANNKWRSFDPCTPGLPFGMLRWQEEAQEALVSDPIRSFFIRTPLSLPEKSLAKRTANLKLGEDGSLEGDIKVEFSGHQSIERKRYYAALDTEKRETKFRAAIQKSLTNAELTNIKFDNLTEPAKPFAYSYHVRVPNYATRTSKRLVVKPAFFQFGDAALFTSSTRKHPLAFDYPWAENDEVRIELPVGFELDHAEAVEGIRAQTISAYEVNIGVTKDQRALVYTRKFFFGGEGYIYFTAAAYPGLKNLFELVQQRDNHQIMLKQAVVASK
ncbi:MAG TPA: DUF3857 and transglutaminase domain-containing protein [Blastocatellia bacterium]|nr:DUF3857 and transglutaminase domain-containing protein [Blastocatellia bacterium]